MTHPQVLILNRDPFEQADLAELFHMPRNNVRVAPDVAGDSLDAESSIPMQYGQDSQAIDFPDEFQKLRKIGSGLSVVAFAGAGQSAVVG